MVLDELRTIAPRSLKHLTAPLERLLRGKIWLQILVGLLFGVLIGWALGPSMEWVDRSTALAAGEWLALPGRLFLAVVQMVVIPLVVSSIIRGLAATEDWAQLRRLGPRVALYFVLTTTLAIGIGLALASWIEPGRYLASDAHAVALGVEGLAAGEEVAPPAEVALPRFNEIPARVVQILPINPLVSMAETQMLQVVLFSIFIGVALLSLPVERSRPLMELMGSLQAVCMTVVRWAMVLAPLAVFGLTARLVSTVGWDILRGLLVYVLTVLGGLLLLLFAYLLIVTLAGKSPLAFLRAARSVQLLAFSTSSTAAVMPLSIRIASDELRVRPSIAELLVPLGATINMDGTALYQGVATLFIAQVFGVELSAASMVLVVLTVVVASIGAPSAPGVGIVILATVLRAAGIPATGIALIIGVDRLLDMCRTALNVTGDLTACVVMERWVGGERSVQAAHTEQEELDRRRQASGEDVIDLGAKRPSPSSR